MKAAFVVSMIVACAESEPARSVTLPSLPAAALASHVDIPRAKSQPGLPTFEQAWEQDSVDSADGPELTSQQLAEPLQAGGFINGCGAPSSMKVTVKVAVHEGLPIGVTVITTPKDDAVRDCIDAAVRKLRWPSSPKRDAVTTTY